MPAATGIVLLLIFSLSAFAQSKLAPAAHATTQLDEVRKRPCDIQMPEGFSCAVLVNVGTTTYDRMIASIVGEDVSQISVYVGGILYTTVYDPPLKRNDSSLPPRNWTHVPVRVEKDDLIVHWPDQTRSKGKIIRRAAIYPNQPLPT